MLKPTRSIILLLACAAILPAAGCARNRAKSDTAYVARDVSSLYTAAKRTMDRGDYETAAKLSTRSSASTLIRCGRAERRS